MSLHGGLYLEFRDLGSMNVCIISCSYKVYASSLLDTAGAVILPRGYGNICRKAAPRYSGLGLHDPSLTKAIAESTLTPLIWESLANLSSNLDSVRPMSYITS